MSPSARIRLQNIKRRVRSHHRLTRKFDGETSATRGNISHTNRSAVLRYDSITDAQSEASSLSYRFRGVERIENPRGVFHTGAAVRKLDDQPVAAYCGTDPEISFGGALPDSV